MTSARGSSPPAGPGRPTSASPIEEALRLHQGGQFDQAERLYRQILRREPNHFDALNLLGLAFLQRDQLADAIAMIDRAIAVNGTVGQAWTTRGMALARLQRMNEALASFDRAIVLNAGLADAFGYRGGVLLALKRYPEALASLDRALALRPDFAIVLLNKGLTLLQMERRAEALASVERLLKLAPDFPYALGLQQRLKAELCAWDGFDERNQQIATAIAAGKQPDVPFQLTLISDRPTDLLECARAYVRDRHPPGEPLWRGERYRHGKVKVAYVSADFREHAVARLIVDLIESHDRDRFELIGVSLGADKPGPMRERLEPAFGGMIDARSMTDAEVAKLLREAEVDIAVDLMGFTNGCRPGIFALRPAPVQINFLGYPGTMGAPYIDYLIADPILITPGDEAFYAEQVIRLPDTYQPNDRRRPIAAEAPSRAAAGLPSDGFVFCCFNNHFKLSPTIFALSA